MRKTTVTAMAVMFLLPAASASAAPAPKLPSEITGTIAGSTVDGSGVDDMWANRHWDGPIVFKPVSKGSNRYKPAAGTAIKWSATFGPPCSGTGAGTLGPKQLVGELLIQYPGREAGGYRWDMIIQPQTAPSPMPVTGSCPNAAGGSVPFMDDASTNLVVNNLDAGRPQNFHSGGLKHFEGAYTQRDGKVHFQWDLKAASNLKAVPHARGAVRGGTAHLDGSRSTPASQIRRYLWRFHEAPGACPAGAAPHSGAHKTGRRVKIVVLCSLKAELTVTDVHGDSDTRSTTVRVRARSGKAWVTPFSHREKAGDSRTPQGKPQAFGDAFASGTAGLNVPDCGNETPGSKIVCPLLEGRRSWAGHGYALKQVNDPHGPFDDDFYVVNPTLSVKRAALFSPNYLPGSAFYEYNKTRTDADLAGFLKAVKAHEGLGGGRPGTGHSQIMKSLVAQAGTNPRLVIEADLGSSRSKVAEAADKHLHEVDARIDVASDDPLPDIFVGPIWAYDDYRQAWTRFPAIRVPGNA
jgi:hypothetical protein